MKKKQKRYSAEFKKEVINYAISTSKGVQEICREFDITSTSYYNWKKEILGDGANGRGVAEEGSGDSKEAMADEIRALRKKLARKDRDIEILKKAALILGEVEGTNMSK